MVDELERSASEKTMPAERVQKYGPQTLVQHSPPWVRGVEYPQVFALDPGTWALMLQILRGQGLAGARAEGHKAV